MTQQTPEKILIDGDTYYFKRPSLGWPLDRYIRSITKDKDSEFFSYNDSTLQRGYMADWMLFGNKLYLTNIEGYRSIEGSPFENGERVTVENLFGKQKIFFHWFTGTMYCKSREGKEINLLFICGLEISRSSPLLTKIIKKITHRVVRIINAL